jgi:hypothetical protein
VGVGDAVAERGGGVNPGQVLQRRISGEYTVDETGFDADVAGLVLPVLGAALRVDVEGAERLPAGGALLVHNQVVGPIETFVLVRGIGLATGRSVRFAGIPDIDPLGPFLRKLGGVHAHPSEVAALLRGGHLVSVGRWRRSRQPALAAVADQLGVPAVEVRVGPGPWPAQWRVAILA